MADETTDVSTIEQVSLCVRYVMVKYEKLEVCEDFLGFCSVSSTDAETITSTMVAFMSDCGLNMEKFVGKGFDGAANMTGHISGVSTRLQQIFQKAKYFTHLKTRFPEGFEDALIATHLLPANIEGLSSENISRIKKEFEDLLPRPETEVDTWTIHIEELESDDSEKRSLLAANFSLKYELYYPNIHTVLSLLLTLTVGSCSCERSFSSLRRLKTWCRNTISNERLDALAVGYINKDLSPSPKDLGQIRSPPHFFSIYIYT